MRISLVWIVCDHLFILENHHNINNFLYTWMDFAWDLFLMTNHFCEQMSRRLIGISYGFGGNTMMLIMN